VDTHSIVLQAYPPTIVEKRQSNIWVPMPLCPRTPLPGGPGQHAPLFPIKPLP